MTRPVRHFWPALESVVGLSAVEAEWRRLLRVELQWALEAGFLRRSGSLARWYPRTPEDPSPLPYDVVKHGEDDFVGVCPDEWGGVRLTREQLLLWEVDVTRLADAVANALGVTSGFESDVLPFTSRVGSYNAGGCGIPVYMTLGLERRHLTASVQTIATLHEPSVVLAPTRSLLAEDCHGVFRARRMCFASLAELLPATDGGRRFAATQTLGQLLAEQRCLPTTRTMPGAHQPRPDGVYGPRTIVYLGREHTCDDLTKRDMKFLHVALQNTELDINTLMHTKHGLLFKKRYSRSRRNLISKFLSRLSDRLSKAVPPIPVQFAMPRDIDCVLRRDPPDKAIPMTTR